MYATRKGRGGGILPGKPPFALRSHSTFSWAEKSTFDECRMETEKTPPPAAGIRATSPRDVEKVDRSSWANLI
jgi:hypothetical protein